MPFVFTLAVGNLVFGYIGPGAGLSALGALLAVSLAVIVALFGFVWYPLRRLRRTIKRNRPSRAEGRRDVERNALESMEPPAGSPAS